MVEKIPFTIATNMKYQAGVLTAKVSYQKKLEYTLQFFSRFSNIIIPFRKR